MHDAPARPLTGPPAEPETAAGPDGRVPHGPVGHQPSHRTRIVLGAGVRLRVHEHLPAVGTVDPAQLETPIVLVHGYPDTSAMWNRVVARLARHHRVVTYDVRGAGGSEAPPRRAAYRLEWLLADLRAVFDDVAPDGPVHLVGHDWGAIQAFAAADELADRLASVTTMSAPGLDLTGAWIRARLRRPTPRGLAALGGQLARSWYVLLFQVPVVPGVAWRTVVGRAWPRLAADLAGPGYPARTVVTDAVKGVALYRANAHRLLRPSPQRLRVPVRVLTGRADPFVSPRLFDDLAAHGDDVRVDEVAGSHWLPRTHPDLVADAVTATVREVRDARRW